ncbi:hypothetical protein [Chitinimonas koreensis]|uniref:hypothetical protein n=1 Tax=Chitinimonas koreensis TaxID=356302 RepID=UPI0004173BF7|nr:hypothetical protein [Chitinimonas koreensis]QNM94705.1 hypothetical protein H9L41_12190 [Chitinimonas koreensis]
MFPWLWLYTPQFHFPFSGGVSQDIRPTTDWFFGAIPPQAGDGDTEQRVFERVSYGRQLNALHDAVVALAAATPPQDEAGRAAMARLAAVQAEIAAAKRAQQDDEVQAARKALAALDPAALAALLREFQPG